MTSRRCCSIRKRAAADPGGMILVDALVALAIGAVFIALIASSSRESRSLYERARERSGHLDAYESGSADLLKSVKPYGNDRTEETIKSGPIEFDKVTADISADPSPDYFQFAGTPLCSVDFAGNGNAPANLTIMPIAIPISPALPLTYLQMRNGIAYVSADSNTAADPDLIIADIRDHSHASVLSSLNTGPGIVSFAIAGKMIYAAAASTVGQLQMIREDLPTSLTLEKRFQLPLPYATATPPYASAIFYDKGLIYLGTEKWDGAEFNIIDASDASDIRVLGSLETGSKINDIYVKNGLAYVAAADQSQLRIVDVSDPAHPAVSSEFSPSGWQRQEGKAVAFFEDALSFGRTSGGFDIKSDHELFSTSNPSTLAFSASTNNPGGIYGLNPDRHRIFAISRQSGKELVIYDQPLSSTTTAYLTLPTSPQSLTCDGDRLYILSATAPYVYEISFK